LIDETVSRALPLLPHRHMLEITKTVERKTYAPHEMILDINQDMEYLYMIADGTVNVMAGNGSHWKTFAHLEAGELFGEVELLNGGKSISQVRAGDESVEVLAYPRQEFLRILEESPITAQALEKMVQSRLEERDRVTRKS
jgi:CRP-like cAMP-binding protein